MTVSAPKVLNEIIDKTVNGDLFEVVAHLPLNFADIMIADPPYNLDKNFNGSKFKKIFDELYEEYTEKWIQAV